MIRVTVEFLPKGSERGKKEIARLEIANTLDGTEDEGSYMAAFVTKGKDVKMHKRHFDGFARNKYNVWALIAVALDSLKRHPRGHFDYEPFYQDDWKGQDDTRNLDWRLA